MFRGGLFAAGRDMFSNGVPFLCSGLMYSHVVDKLFPSKRIEFYSNGNTEKIEFINNLKYWFSVLSTSVISTYLSQVFHSCQITIQSNQQFNYAQSIAYLWKNNGWSMFFKGAEARVGLLLAVSILNQLLLKKAWSDVEIEE